MEEKKKGFFSKLVAGLSKTRSAIVSSIENVFLGYNSIDEDFYEELEEILIMGDIGIKTSSNIIEEIKTKVKDLHIKDPAECKEILISSIRERMELCESAYEFENRKSVLLIIGVNGVGKTTSVGKLAGQFKQANLYERVAVASHLHSAIAQELSQEHYVVLPSQISCEIPKTMKKISQKGS